MGRRREQMKKSRYTEEQIVGVLKESNAGMETGELCAAHHRRVEAGLQLSPASLGVAIPDAEGVHSFTEGSFRHPWRGAGDLKRRPLALTTPSPAAHNLRGEQNTEKVSLSLLCFSGAGHDASPRSLSLRIGYRPGELVIDSEQCEFQPIRYAQLIENVAHVMFHRLLADRAAGCDIRI